MAKYCVKLQITHDYFIEAKSEEHARRIVAECYSDDMLYTLEQGDTEVYIFNEEDES